MPTGLSSLKIPDGVSSIGTDAFRGCYALESLSIPNSVESVEALAFDGCSSLKSAVVTQYILDRNVASIMGGAARTLTNITVSEGVTEIRDRAFAGCYSLESVSIPDSVKSIGFAANNKNKFNSFCRRKKLLFK